MVPRNRKHVPDEAFDTATQSNDKGSHGPSVQGYYSTADFRDAYLKGTLNPTKVVEALLRAVKADANHKTAFLYIKKDICLAAAARSTDRYRSGASLGSLDGVPVAVKDEVDLKGYPRCFGSHKTAVNEAGATSWCVRQWEDAGAIVVGKLNMHEFGMGPFFRI